MPGSRDFNVEDVQRMIKDTWVDRVAKIDAYSPPENRSKAGKKLTHDHACITLTIVKVALGKTFTFDDAEFLSKVMDEHDDCKNYGLKWFTPVKTIQKRTKATTVYNRYHSPKLQLPKEVTRKVFNEKLKRKEDKIYREPGHTWNSAHCEHKEWAEHSKIIAKNIVAIQACTATKAADDESPKTFDAVEMACKAIALWKTVTIAEFERYKAEAKAEDEKKPARGAKEPGSTVVVPPTANGAEAITRRRQPCRNKKTPILIETANPNDGILTFPSAPAEFESDMGEKSKANNEKETKEESNNNKTKRAREDEEPDSTVVLPPSATAAPAAPAPAAAAVNLSLASFNKTRKSLYGYYRYQLFEKDVPHYTYEEINNAQVHQSVPAAVEEKQGAMEPEELWRPEEDEQQPMLLFPKEEEALPSLNESISLLRESISVDTGDPKQCTGESPEESLMTDALTFEDVMDVDSMEDN